jgi:hypothetical protein
VLVCAVIDDSLAPTSPLGDSLDVFVRHEDAERFIEEVKRDERKVAQAHAVQTPVQTSRFVY